MAVSMMVMRPLIYPQTHCNNHANLRASIWPVSRISWHHDPRGTVLHRPRIHNPSKLGLCGSPECWGEIRHGCHGGRPIVPRVNANSDKDDGVPGTGGDCQAIAAAGLTVGFAVVNRVLYKLALVPMKDYPFFMAQLTTFGYVIVYFTILYSRYRLGIVTNEMLAFPKLRFVVVGALEALGVAAGMAAGANLSGASIPILSQTFLVWQLILSVLLLGRRYSLSQLFGCLLVSAGVIMAVSSGVGTGELSEEVGFFWPLLMITSNAFQAAASILKESVFIDAAKRLKAGSMDIFVVNSFGSGFQALFVFLLLPFLSKLKGIPFSHLPGYFKDGAACFVNMGSTSNNCDGAPLLPLLYIAINMIFNISVLRLVKVSSAVVSSLAVTLAVPLSIFAFTLPLPYITAEPTLPLTFILGAAILVLGLLIYNMPETSKEAAKKL